MQLSMEGLSVRERQRLAIAVLDHSGISRKEIANHLDVHEDTVGRWQKKNESDFNIWDLERSGRGRTYDVDVEDRFIAFYCQTTPFDNAGRWSLRWAEDHLKKNESLIEASPSRSTLHRMLERHDLKPHKVRYFLQITDPDFFPKMEHLIDLYKNPPEHLFCFDECPGIQILKRLTPDMHPGDEGGMLKWINEFEYIRNGTTDLFAFLDVNAGTIKTAFHANHQKETFIAEFKKHVDGYPKKASLNYVMDNLASHYSYEFCQLVAELSCAPCPSPDELKTPDQRRQWLQSDDKRIVIHFTPFHGSWLNMGEIVFRLISEKVLTGSYGSPDELHDAVEQFVKEWNEGWAHPFVWRYDGKGLHEKVVQRFTSILMHSANEVTLQYLTKSSKLMVNMMEQYWGDVPRETWKRLFDAVSEQENILRGLIENDLQPIVKKKAAIALDHFLNKINAVLLKEEVAS